MPGFDGTGPRGMGAMTGGGFGNCGTGAGYGGYGRGRGYGRGFGRDFGRGFGPGYGGVYAVAPVVTLSPEEEKASLEHRLELLEQEATRIKDRLESWKS